MKYKWQYLEGQKYGFRWTPWVTVDKTPDPDYGFHSVEFGWLWWQHRARIWDTEWVSTIDETLAEIEDYND